MKELTAFIAQLKMHTKRYSDREGLAIEQLNSISRVII